MTTFLWHGMEDLVRVDGQRIRIFHEPCPGPVWSQRKRYNQFWRMSSARPVNRVFCLSASLRYLSIEFPIWCAYCVFFTILRSLGNLRDYNFPGSVLHIAYFDIAIESPPPVLVVFVATWWPSSFWHFFFYFVFPLS